MPSLRARVARQPRPCGAFGCRQVIGAGEAYLLWTIYPGNDDEMGYATQAGHPVRGRECEGCARRSGHGHLIDARRNS